jgi:hypothetical protein
MRLPIFFKSASIIIALIVLTSCDRRNGGIVDGGYYSVDLQPVDSVVVADDILRIYCFVTDYRGYRVDGAVIHFTALDSGSISYTRISDSSSIDGLNADLYYEPEGNVGTCRIVAEVFEDNSTSAVDVDTETVTVLPYNVALSAEFDAIQVLNSSELECRIFDPLTSTQTGNVHIRFFSLDFGTVPNGIINSSATSANGMQSVVYYLSTDSSTGFARIVANAVYGTQEKLMGTDTTVIEVMN